MKMYNNYFAIATDVLLNTEIYIKKELLHIMFIYLNCNAVETL